MRFLTALTALLGLCCIHGVARAEDCSSRRPTDPGGVRGYDYGASPVQSFATDHIRVWYTIEGTHSVRSTTTRADQVPDDVALAAAVSEDAYVRYGQMKFRTPISDGTHPACVTNGGDGKTDIYLMHFTAADGQTVPEQCKGTPKVCSGFILADSRLQNYKTFEEGVRTVLPHELFHAVQGAYDSEMDGYWSEGSAQWAAKTLAPSLKDLEHFLPVFFKEPSRSIDTPPGGSAAAYLYATAIWPVFLGERFDADIIREVLEAEGASHVPAMDAVSSVLVNRKSSLANEFPTFVVWNTATAARAGGGGYANAASYPTLPSQEFPAEGSAQGITAGYSSAIYHVAPSQAVEYFVDTDAERNQAMLVPLRDGIVRVTEAKKLPAILSGEGFVVVTGITAKKSDAPYTLATRAPAAAGDAGTPSSSGGSSGEEGGCSARNPQKNGAAPVASFCVIGALLGYSAWRRSSKRSTSASS